MACAPGSARRHEPVQANVLVQNDHLRACRTPKSDAPDRVRTVAPRHAAYWRQLGLDRYLSGPFADRSGGLITFEAGSIPEAEQLVADDPFAQEDLLERRWVNEWATD
jgi:uncharacterized protein YciI